MKASQEFIKQLEGLYQAYEKEVKEKELEKNTEKTYLRHAGTFVRWCKDDFEPGVIKSNKSR
ncbi:hypothetical protein [Salinibacillus xinjiangensis]|uniref:Uncharacterized protein n=1 Tax=Salinibacillus xinjiangensis TaxID=1229268 RepID=A0A6G1X6Z8_9BACI|nr:hypothetical protein [Salinibacillus xinjiangensis]MRG86712.1 hypothetical protein [Salinibacillus xinjiangensis]